MAQNEPIKVDLPQLTERQKDIAKHCKFESETQIIVVSTGRQVGKSTIATVVALYWTINKPNISVGYFMPVFKQCKNMFKRFKQALDNIPNVKYNLTELVITFDNGSSIQFFSAETDSCRGNTFDYLICDEACFISTEIFKSAIEPTIAVKLSKGHGKMLLLSTPKSKNWFFNYFISTSLKNKVSIKFTSEEGGLISSDILNQWRLETPQHIFANEYLAEFMEDGSGIFEYKNSIFDRNFDESELSIDGCIGAVDWGTQDDYTVLSIFNAYGEHVFIERWRHKDWMDLVDIIAPIARKFKCVKLYSECNGVGAMPTAELKKRYASTYEWWTSTKSKVDIIQKLAYDVKSQSVKLLNRDYLIQEMDAYTYEYNPSTGRISYGARSGAHDDTIMATAIANWNRTNGGRKYYVSKPDGKIKKSISDRILIHRK